MMIPNTLLVLDALLGIMEIKSKMETVLLAAKAENRDVTEKEWMDLNTINIQKSLELEDLIKQKIKEYNQ